MTPEQHAEFEAFTAMKMAVHREMFPSGDKIIAAMKAGKRTLILDSAPRFTNVAEANAAFEAEVMRRWNARKSASPAIVTVPGNFQANIDAAYARGEM